MFTEHTTCRHYMGHWGLMLTKVDMIFAFISLQLVADRKSKEGIKIVYSKCVLGLCFTHPVTPKPVLRLSLPYHHVVFRYQGPSPSVGRRVYEYPKLLINGGEQWLPMYFRWKTTINWTIRIKTVKDKTNGWHDFSLWAVYGMPRWLQEVYRHWFSFSRYPQDCPPWLAILLMLALLAYICPVWSDLSFPGPPSSKAMPVLHPITLLLLSPKDSLFRCSGGEAMLHFSFILFLLLFLQSKLCSQIPSGLLFRYSKACLEVLKKEILNIDCFLLFKFLL